jgi:hypothetical protein
MTHSIRHSPALETTLVTNAGLGAVCAIAELPARVSVEALSGTIGAFARLTAEVPLARLCTRDTHARIAAAVTNAVFGAAGSDAGCAAAGPLASFGAATRSGAHQQK